VRFRTTAALDAAVLDGLPVTSLERVGDRVRLLSAEPERSARAIRRGVDVADLEVAGADLEEAFLALTTRRPSAHDVAARSLGAMLLAQIRGEVRYALAAARLQCQQPGAAGRAVQLLRPALAGQTGPRGSTSARAADVLRGLRVGQGDGHGFGIGVAMERARSSTC